MMKIVNWGVRTLNRYGFHLMRSYRILQCELNLLSLAIPAVLYQKNKVRFIQIGASDGITNDPLHPLVVQYRDKLEGVCVEPIPDVFETLRETYKNYPEIQLENAAISDEGKDLILYKPIDSADRSASQKASLTKDMVSKHGFTSQEIEEIKVKGISFKELVKKYNFSELEIDLLIIDAEGNDTKILISVFESGYFPKMIQYESLHLNKEERQTSRQLLSQNEYDYIETEKDTFAVRKNALMSK